MNDDYFKEPNTMDSRYKLTDRSDGMAENDLKYLTQSYIQS